MIYLYLFGTCFHFIYVFMIIGNNKAPACESRGLVHKKRCANFDTPPLVFYRLLQLVLVVVHRIFFLKPLD